MSKSTPKPNPATSSNIKMTDEERRAFARICEEETNRFLEKCSDSYNPFEALFGKAFADVFSDVLKDKGVDDDA